MSTKYDVIIIGSGAGGGTLARHLAPSGKSILILERGDWLKREQQNWDAEEVFIKNRYVPKETWYDKTGQAVPTRSPLLRRRRHQDVWRGALSPAQGRLRRAQALRRHFAGLAHRLRRHGALLHQGRADVPGAWRARRRPTEPPSSAPYPFPAVSHEPRIQQLHDDLARAGYRPFHAPCGVMLNEQNAPFSACIRCKDCDGFPCLVHAKSDAEVLAVRPALQYPNVTLLTNARAVKLNTNPTGKAVTEVVVERNGRNRNLSGRHRRGFGGRCQFGQVIAAVGQR